MKVKGAKGGTEPELISWDEVEAQKDVYEAITTADGRQALVKAAPGVYTAPVKSSGCPVFHAPLHSFNQLTDIRRPEISLSCSIS